MIIEVSNLSKKYGATLALNGVSLNIEAGGVVGLLGPNGAGKTTFVEILEGLRSRTTGNVAVLGMDPGKQPRQIRESIGVQLQSTAAPLELTPLETLRLFAAFFKKSLKPMTVLERVGLAQRAKIRNWSLSGGERQRLAIAMALINDPELIVLDEPTSGLDPVGRREVHSTISDLRAAGKTVLLSTHYIEEAEKLCDRVIILRAGEVVADGTPTSLAAGSSEKFGLLIVLRGEFDATPLLNAGALAKERDGADHAFTASNPEVVLPVLAEMLRTTAVALVDLRMQRNSLEDAYLALMGQQAEANS